MSSRKSKDDVQTSEHGDIYFFYRPRVEEEDPENRSDLQRFYMVLSPNEEKRYRLIEMGQKHLPEAGRSRKNRQWGFVDTVRKSPKAIREVLGEESYQTKTRGERHLPMARPAGEGVYRILRHGDHTHLVYALELPDEPGDVQKSLDIKPEMSYIISIANPERGGAQTAGLSKKRQADFPKYLLERFRDRKFAAAEPPEFLDKEGAELVLLAASEDIGKELGIELDTEDESANRGC